MLRASSSTMSTLRPRRISFEWCSRSMISCFSTGSSLIDRCRKSAVSSSRRSGERTSLRTMLLAVRCSRFSSLAVSSLPVKTMTGRLSNAGSAWIFSSNSKPLMSGRRRSSTTHSKGRSSRAESASPPVATPVISMSSCARRSVTAWRSVSLSSTTSRRLVCGSR